MIDDDATTYHDVTIIADEEQQDYYDELDDLDNLDDLDALHDFIADEEQQDYYDELDEAELERLEEAAKILDMEEKVTNCLYFCIFVLSPLCVFTS